MGIFNWIKSKMQNNDEHNNVIRIRLSGDEHIDIIHSFEQMGINDTKEQNEILKNYTWHYLDDLDEDLTCTMQLVQTEVLEATKPFLDSRDIFEEAVGIKYRRK